jgi:hypothetical protein
MDMVNDNNTVVDLWISSQPIDGALVDDRNGGSYATRNRPHIIWSDTIAGRPNEAATRVMAHELWEAHHEVSTSTYFDASNSIPWFDLHNQAIDFENLLPGPHRPYDDI